MGSVPSRVIDGDTPHHRLLGKHARLDHFKAFGCKAYVQVYDRHRKKMDDKAWRGIMIGYDEHNTRCYRVYDPVRKVVRDVVHVTFDESVFPARKGELKSGISSGASSCSQGE